MLVAKLERRVTDLLLYLYNLYNNIHIKAIIMYSLYTNSYKEYAYAATIGLAAFTAMTILIFHFPTNKEEVISFTKNLSILGGLMLLSQRFA